MMKNMIRMIPKIVRYIIFQNENFLQRLLLRQKMHIQTNLTRTFIFLNAQTMIKKDTKIRITMTIMGITLETMIMTANTKILKR